MDRNQYICLCTCVGTIENFSRTETVGEKNKMVCACIYCVYCVGYYCSKCVITYIHGGYSITQDLNTYSLMSNSSAFFETEF